MRLEGFRLAAKALIVLGVLGLLWVVFLTGSQLYVLAWMVWKIGFTGLSAWPSILVNLVCLLIAATAIFLAIRWLICSRLRDAGLAVIIGFGASVLAMNTVALVAKPLAPGEAGISPATDR